MTGSDDSTARVWDLSGATPKSTTLEGHRGEVLSVAITPDGKQVLTGSSDGTARVWKTPVEELIPLARSALTLCLTIAQRDALGLPIIPAPGWTASTSVRRPVREPAREGRCVFGILEPLRREPFKLRGAHRQHGQCPAVLPE